MGLSEVKTLYNNSIRKISSVKLDIKRYLYHKINWNNRLIGIKGERGTGKTTLILQHIRDSFNDLEKVLYVSMDDMLFTTNSIFDLVEYHVSHGGTHIFMDEIHRYPHWQSMVKNLYDRYGELHIVYTGSSMLELDTRESDLSRRLRSYVLHGMSFREFLSFEIGLEVPAVSLTELLQSHQHKAIELTSKVKILPLFEKYLQCGYYPYYTEEGDGFLSRLQSTVRQVIETDLPSIEDISFATIQKLKKMLMILSEHVPQTPKMNDLYAQLETGRDQGLKMMHLLERAGLMSLLNSEVKSFKQLAKPDKIYLGNPNLMYCLTTKVDTGTLRETFFNTMLGAEHMLLYPNKGDFLVDGKWLFEVGGAGKDFSQIRNIPNSFLAVGDTEFGLGNRIPLWMFGLMY